MQQQYLPIILLLLLAAMLVRAAVTDIRSRIISNRLNAVMALLAPVYWLALGLDPWPAMAVQAALGLGVLLVFATLFAMGMMGGGDVKMLAALALWLPVGGLVSLLTLMALLGAGVTIAALAHHRITRRIGQVEVPYGVAIAAAGLWVIGEPYLNHFI